MYQNNVLQPTYFYLSDEICQHHLFMLQDIKQLKPKKNLQEYFTSLGYTETQTKFHLDRLNSLRMVLDYPKKEFFKERYPLYPGKIGTFLLCECNRRSAMYTIRVSPMMYKQLRDVEVPLIRQHLRRYPFK